MRDFPAFMLLTIVYLALKSTLLPTVTTPDLTLIIAFFLAYDRPSARGLLLCFVLGYIEDVLGGSIIGTTSLSLVLVYALTHLVAVRVHFDSGVPKALGTGTASLVKGMITYFIMASINQEVHILRHVLPTAAVTALFTPFVISLFERTPFLRGPGRTEGDTF